jgi:hypothetical protein
MEWCCGGDLMFHVQKLGKFDEEKARSEKINFYVLKYYKFYE